MHPVYERPVALASALGLSDEFGDFTVGKKHELLHELIGLLHLLEIDAEGFPVLIQTELGFLTLETNRTVLESLRPQLLCQFVEF